MSISDDASSAVHASAVQTPTKDAGKEKGKGKARDNDINNDNIVVPAASSTSLPLWPIRGNYVSFYIIAHIAHESENLLRTSTIP